MNFKRKINKIQLSMNFLKVYLIVNQKKFYSNSYK